MSIYHAVVISFNSPHSHYTEPWPKDGERAARSVDIPQWWVNRSGVFRDYTLKSLNQQTCRSGLDVVVLVQEKHREVAVPCTKAALDAGALVLYGERLEELRKHYAAKLKDNDWFIYSHLDSDDMYARDALERVRVQKMSPGLVILFLNGYMYNIAENIMWEYICNNAAPSFFSVVYSGACLKSAEAFNAYRKKHELNKFHYQFPQCKNKVVLPSWNFCMTMNGSNITTSYTESEYDEKVWGKG